MKKKLKRVSKLLEYGAGEYQKVIYTIWYEISTLFVQNSHLTLRYVHLMRSSPDITIVNHRSRGRNNITYYAMNHIFSLKIMAVMLGNRLSLFTNSDPTGYEESLWESYVI